MTDQSQLSPHSITPEQSARIEQNFANMNQEPIVANWMKSPMAIIIATTFVVCVSLVVASALFSAATAWH
jgi:hypothetical protein